MRFARLTFALCSCSCSGSSSTACSTESLLRSPWALLISLLKLARLERRLPNADDVKDAGLWSEKGLPLGWMGGRNALSLVIVELLLVNDGTSTDILTISGPGSPISRD